jgi:hypothetical protein
VISHPYFDGIVMLSVIIAGIVVGIQSYPKMQSDLGIDVIDILVQVVFTLDCLFKIAAQGVNPANYWAGPERNWNNFGEFSFRGGK